MKNGCTAVIVAAGTAQRMRGIDKMMAPLRGTPLLLRTVRAALIATSRQGLFFIPLLLMLPRLLGETGLVLCQSASDVLSLLLTLLLLRGTLTGSACARCGCSDAPTACR